MAANLHDPQVRASIEARIKSLSSASQGRWGKMTVDQMLWHCNEGMSAALGDRVLTAQRVPLPRAVMKFGVLNLPWPKGAPTMPELVSGKRHDFEAERSRAVQLIERFAGRSVDDTWPVHPVFGKFSGADYSRLIAKHLDHHLRQFGC